MSAPRAVAAFVLLAALLHGLTLALPTGALMDFGSFIASGRAAAQGLDPYGIHDLTFHVVLPGFEAWNPNLNPPPLLPAFQALSLLPPDHGFRLWWAVSALCYGITLWLLFRRYRRPLVVVWALALAGFWDTLVLGQIYLPLVLAAVAAWLALERGQGWRAGVLIGMLVAAKPNFAVWPALLLVAGHGRPALAAGLTAAVLAVTPALLYGPQVWGQWLHLVLTDADRAHFLTNASLSGLARRLGMPGLGIAASLALLAGAGWQAWRCRPDVAAASALALAVAVAASPIAWVHYTLFLLPVFFSRPHSRPLLAAALLLVVPVPWVLRALAAPWWEQASYGSLYAWAMILCLWAVRLPSPQRCRTPTG